MAPENVKTVLDQVDAWNRGDRESWLAGGHPEIEWSSAILRQVEGDETTSRGRAEMERFWNDWHAVWNLTIEPTETRDLGDTVLLLAEMHTRGKASGAEVARSVGYVFEFEDGLIRRARAYLSPEEALAAAGQSQ